MRTAALLLCTLLLVACDPDAPDPSKQEAVRAADPSDPCSLLSSGDIAGAVARRDVEEGREVESRPDSRGATVPLCVFRTGPPYASVTIYVENPVAEEEFRGRIERDPINTKEVTDIGELAFIHAGVSLSLFVADTAITATVQHFDSVADTEVVLRKIGAAALRRTET
jgi:hypothetical protein